MTSNLNNITPDELKALTLWADERVYEECKKSYYKFMRRSWECFDPAIYVPNWYHGIICEHVQAAFEREIRRLLITMCPRLGKTVSQNTEIVKSSGEIVCIKDLQIGDELITLNPSTGKHEFKKVTHHFGIYDKELYKVTFHSGEVLECSLDHELYTWSGFKRLKDLQVGDNVSFAKTYPTSPTSSLSKDEVLLLALWQAEGTKKGYGYVITNGDVLILDYLKDYCNKYNKEYSIQKQRNCNHFRIKNFTHFVKSFYPTRPTTYNLHIPNEVFTLDDELLTDYLGMWIATDGSIVQGKKAPYIEISLASERCVRELGYLFKRLGFYVTHTYKKSNQKSSVTGRNFESWRITIRGAANLKLAKQLFKGKVWSKNTLLDNLPETLSPHSNQVSIPPDWVEEATTKDVYNINRIKEGKRWSSLESILNHKEIISSTSVLSKISQEETWRKIVSIEPLGIQECSDIEVEDNYNFVLANGCHVHNSICTSVNAAPWRWLHDPGEKIWNVTNGEDLYHQNIRYARNIIDSEWYTNRWLKEDKLYTLSKDQNTKGRIDNDAGGFLFGTSPKSKQLGKGFTVAIIDDIIDSEESYSPTELQRCNTYYKRTLINRSNSRGSKGNDVIICVAQRLQINDLPHLLEEEYGFFRLNLMAEFDKRKTYFSPLGEKWNDPRTKDGELLDPIRLDEDVCAEEKKNFSNWSARFQQDPVPATGNIIQNEWISFYSEDWRTMIFDVIYIVWDYSFTDDPESSYTVGLLVGKKDDSYYILDMIRDKMSYGKQVQSTQKSITTWPQISYVVIEKKANGEAVICSLETIIKEINSSVKIITVDPTKYGGSKEKRVAACIPTLMKKKLYLPINNLQTPAIVTELTSFPQGTNDIVDCITYAILWGEKRNNFDDSIYLTDPTKSSSYTRGLAALELVKENKEVPLTATFIADELGVPSITHAYINDIFK